MEIDDELIQTSRMHTKNKIIVHSPVQFTSLRNNEDDKIFDNR